jgi:arsenite methyltransferase
VEGDCQSKDRRMQIEMAVLEKYRSVAKVPRGQFSYPVGRESALKLGHEPEWLDTSPPEVVERFVGVGNPFSLRRPGPGERVLDAGCGCGLDAFVASLLVGPKGRVVGLDLSNEMLEVSRNALARSNPGNLGFEEGSVEQLPFADGSFDLVISNGVLNLALDKRAAFREIARVLRAGGIFATADLLVIDTVPEKLIQDVNAWSG